MIFEMLYAKIHRASITQADIDYEGSIGIDNGILKKTPSARGTLLRKIKALSQGIRKEKIMKIEGAKLSAARYAAFASRPEVAKVACLSHARIWQLETEAVSNVNDNVARAMADFLGVSVDSLCPDEQTGERT
jgi:transcriptional regulator with XRE-family HTH domain